MLKFGSSQLFKTLRTCTELVKLQRSCHAATMEMIKMEKVGEKKNVALVTLDRPKAYNAICDKLIDELTDTLTELDKEKSVGAIVITGSTKAFAVGADIRELHNMTFVSAITGQVLGNWTQISKVNKPVIAAVNGYALGGGCELAMMCDIIYAGEQAKFGQPEVTIGTIPGVGGTQRWTRVAGKSLAMELCLTGQQLTAQEAKDCGIVSKIFPDEKVVSEAIKTGELIASFSPIITQMIKDCVNRAYETTLYEGLRYERRMFHATMATKDQKEGMAAFLEKRKPEWTAS